MPIQLIQPVVHHQPITPVQHIQPIVPIIPPPPHKTYDVSSHGYSQTHGTGGYARTYNNHLSYPSSGQPYYNQNSGETYSRRYGHPNFVRNQYNNHRVTSYGHQIYHQQTPIPTYTNTNDEELCDHSGNPITFPAAY